MSANNAPTTAVAPPSFTPNTKDGTSTTTTEGSVVAGGKRPRRGEGTISDPSTISLHHTDFVWGTMFLGEGRSTVDAVDNNTTEGQPLETTYETNKAFLEAYLKSMLGRLEQVKEDPVPLMVVTPTHVNDTTATVSEVSDAATVPTSSSASPPTTTTPQQPPPKESSAWEDHYTRNLNQFFPYKNYLVKAFPDLEGIIVSSIANAANVHSSSGDAEVEEVVHAVEGQQQRSPIIVMECGCGTGSALLPIIHFTTPATARFIVFDISPKAVEVFRRHQMVEDYLSRPWGGKDEYTGKDDAMVAAKAFMSFPYNISTRGANLDAEFVQKRFEELQQHQPLSPASSLSVQSPWAPQSVDLLLLIFTLCAMESVADMHLALRRLHYWVRPGKWVDKEGSNDAGAAGATNPPSPVWKGGKLLFRDYGMFDHNMFRFGSKSASAECNLAEGELFCKKADGTSQFFFDVTFTKALFEAAGFVCLKLDYHCNTVKNRKTGVSMHKVFVNGEFGVLQ